MEGLLAFLVLCAGIALWQALMVRTYPRRRDKPELSDTSALMALRAIEHPVLVKHAETQERIELERQSFYEWFLSDEELTPDVEPTTAPEQDRGRIHFKKDEPRSLLTYGSQAHVVKPLDMAIKALAVDQVVLDHKLLTGPPGLGKTLLSKVIAHELQVRASLHGVPAPVFVETYGANLNSSVALDQVVRSLTTNPASIWFIDEIHVLNQELATKIYLLMEEGRYPFEGSLNPTPIPNVMLIGATTDYGSMHSALKRRFGEALMLRPMSRGELEALAPKLGFPIEPEAVTHLVSRCWQSGAPWELKTLFRECMIFATATGNDRITTPVVQDVFDTFEIDDHGLRAVDRSVLSALFKRPRYRGKQQEFYCYGGSESDVCAVTKLDRTEFQETIRPRLMSRGFLEVRSGVGLALTPTAIHEYQHLNA